MPHRGFTRALVFPGRDVSELVVLFERFTLIGLAFQPEVAAAALTAFKKGLTMRPKGKAKAKEKEAA